MDSALASSPPPLSLLSSLPNQTGFLAAPWAGQLHSHFRILTLAPLPAWNNPSAELPSPLPRASTQMSAPLLTMSQFLSEVTAKRKILLPQIPNLTYVRLEQQNKASSLFKLQNKKPLANFETHLPHVFLAWALWFTSNYYLTLLVSFTAL